MKSWRQETEGTSEILHGAEDDERRLARRLRSGFRQAGKRLNMGKSCIRFRKAQDLNLEVIGEVVASTPLEQYVERAKAARRR